MLTVRVPERVRNKCERVTGPQPERFRSVFAGVNATRTSGTGPVRDRNANRNRCEHGLRRVARKEGDGNGSTMAEEDLEGSLGRRVMGMEVQWQRKT